MFSGMLTQPARPYTRQVLMASSSISPMDISQISFSRTSRTNGQTNTADQLRTGQDSLSKLLTPSQHCWSRQSRIPDLTLESLARNENDGPKTDLFLFCLSGQREVSRSRLPSCHRTCCRCTRSKCRRHRIEQVSEEDLGSLADPGRNSARCML
jgi:hypothetical protein